MLQRSPRGHQQADHVVRLRFHCAAGPAPGTRPPGFSRQAKPAPGASNLLSRRGNKSHRRPSRPSRPWFAPGRQPPPPPAQRVCGHCLGFRARVRQCKGNINAIPWRCRLALPDPSMDSTSPIVIFSRTRNRHILNEVGYFSCVQRMCHSLNAVPGDAEGAGRPCACVHASPRLGPSHGDALLPGASTDCASMVPDACDGGGGCGATRWRSSPVRPA